MPFSLTIFFGAISFLAKLESGVDEFTKLFFKNIQNISRFFFDIGVIVYPLSTITLWRNDCLTLIHQYWARSECHSFSHGHCSNYRHTKATTTAFIVVVSRNVVPIPGPPLDRTKGTNLKTIEQKWNWLDLNTGPFDLETTALSTLPWLLHW